MSGETPDLMANLRDSLDRARSERASRPAGQDTGHKWPCTRFYVTATERDRCTCPKSVSDRHQQAAELLYPLGLPIRIPFETQERLVRVAAALAAADRDGYQRGREETAQAWDEGFEAAAEWMVSNGRIGIPHDPPLNPYDRNDDAMQTPEDIGWPW